MVRPERFSMGLLDYEGREKGRREREPLRIQSMAARPLAEDRLLCRES